MLHPAPSAAAPAADAPAAPMKRRRVRLGGGSTARGTVADGSAGPAWQNRPVPPTRRAFLAATAAAGASLYLGREETAHAPPDAPNVLLVMIDTLRVDHVYGSAARTPVMDALAAEGLIFTHVFPEAMPTVPVRNSLLSGRRMFPFRDWHDHRGLLAKPGWEPLDDVGEILTTVMRREGWWTGYVTDNPFLGFSQPYEVLRRSFDLFVRHGGQIGGRDVPVPAAKLERWLHPTVVEADMTERVRRYIANADYADDETHSFAAQVFSSGVEALSVAARNRPFVLMVDAYEPHEPWTPPRSYTRLYGDPDYRGPEPAMPRYGRVENWLAPDEADLVLERLRALYAAEVTMTDRWLAALLGQMRDLGLERETIVVLMSDHGIQLGDRGWTGKISIALHPELIQVPLVIVHPDRLRAGERSSYYASPHDLARTLLTMTGVRTPDYMEGVDLSVLFRGEEPPARDVAYGGYADSHFLRDERWAYMSDNAGEHPKLFDLTDDPGESANLAFLRPDLVEELRAQVEDRAGGALQSYS
jgi:arylsulfatase A-like enzyme